MIVKYIVKYRERVEESSVNALFSMEWPQKYVGDLQKAQLEAAMLYLIHISVEYFKGWGFQ